MTVGVKYIVALNALLLSFIAISAFAQQPPAQPLSAMTQRLQRDWNTFEGAKSSLSEAIGALMDDWNVRGAKIAELQKDVAAKDAKIAALQKEIDQLKPPTPAPAPSPPAN